MSSFEALEVAMQLVEAMAPIIEKVQKRDSGMAMQMKDATTSIPSNLSEGARRRGKDRTYLFSVAAGSAGEVKTQVRIAKAWRYIDDAAFSGVAEWLDRTCAITWRLVNPRG